MSRAAIGKAMAREAERLVGTKFRLHGRDPDTGLDCVGLVVAAASNAGRPISFPFDYSLRMKSVTRLFGAASQAGLAPASTAIMPGDILLFALGQHQHHCAIALDGRNMVHAHAGLRKVVRSAWPADGDVIGRWRFARTARKIEK